LLPSAINVGFPVLVENAPQSGLSARDSGSEYSVVADFVLQRFVMGAAAGMVRPHVVDVSVALPPALLVDQSASIVRKEAPDFRRKHIVVTHGDPWSVSCCCFCVLHDVSQSLLSLLENMLPRWNI